MGMIFLCDEDVDSKAIVSSWLTKNNADDNMKRLMDEMFFKGLISNLNYEIKHYVLNIISTQKKTIYFCLTDFQL